MTQYFIHNILLSKTQEYYSQSWVGLTTTDGEQIFNGQISAGQVATFSDPNLIRAVIGNAGAVKLILNGKDLGVPGAQGEVIRLDFDANGQL